MKRKPKKPNRRRGESIFECLPKKRAIDRNDVEVWIDAALKFGAIFFVNHLGTEAEMHTNSNAIAVEGIFATFRAYARAHPDVFVSLLRERADKAPDDRTLIFPIEQGRRVSEMRYIIREKRS